MVLRVLTGLVVVERFLVILNIALVLHFLSSEQFYQDGFLLL